MPGSITRPFDPQAWIGQVELLGYRLELLRLPERRGGGLNLLLHSRKVATDMAAAYVLWRRFYGHSEADYNANRDLVIAELLTRTAASSSGHDAGQARRGP